MKRMFLVVCATVFLTSCESRTYTDISVVVDNPTYEANVKPVIQKECSSCHSGDTFPPLNNYGEVREAAENGDLLCKINGQCGAIMPPDGKMEQGTVDMINLWAEQGFVEK